MLFAFLIQTVASQFGPITGYNTFQMSKHVHAEYLRSEGEVCTIAITIQRNSDDKLVSWNSFAPVNPAGERVQILALAPQGVIFQDGVERGVIVTDDDVRSGINLSSRVSYVVVSPDRRFTYDLTLNVLNRDGETSSESTKVYCDQDQCECSTRGYPVNRL